jgi:acetyl esterase
MTAIKLTGLMLLAGLQMVTIAPEIRAEDAWLSTPESITTFRQQVEAIRPSASQFELASIEDRKITLGDRDINIRIYDPLAAAPQSLLIYVHGGCWVAGSLDSHDEVSRYLALRGNTKVIAIDYRLAPEHKFPAAHDDVYDTIQWVWDHADELGVDRSRIALGGESAGAHLAAATALRMSEESGAPRLAFLLLVYAALDGGGSSWTECKDLYFENKDDARSRFGSPLWAEDLSRMPSAYNIHGEFEPSRAEQELFVRKLREDRVAVDSFMNPGVGHDVGTWLKASGNLAAHETAVQYIHQGFAESP